MIYKHVLLIFIFSLVAANPFSSSAQSNATINAKIDDIKKLLTDAGNTQKVGILLIVTGPVKTYRNGEESGRRLLIDSASFIIKDGYILDLNIYSDGHHFINTNAPIAINTERLGQEESLFDIHSDVGKFSVLLDEVIQFHPLSSYQSDDTAFTLTPANSFCCLSRGVGINSVIDVRLYTDGAALAGKANGLVQADAHFKYIIHRDNYRNSGLFLFQYIKANFTAAKFDSKTSTEDTGTFERSQLLQKSWLGADVSLNLANLWLSKKSVSRAYCDVGAGFNVSNLARGKDTLDVICPLVYNDFGVDLRPSDNVGFNLSVRTMVQWSPQTNFNDKGYDLDYIFVRPTMELFWNPFGNKSGRVFSRVTYTFGVNRHEQRNGFFQFQFGYSVLLSSIAKTK